MTNYDLKLIYSWPLVPRIIVIGVVCLIVLYLGYFFDLSNQLKKIKVIKQQVEDLKVQFISMASNMTEIRDDLEKYSVLVGALAQSQKKLITSPELSELLNEILKMGAKNELEFNYFSPGTEIKEGSHIKIPIKVIVEGTYDQIASFISQIANMDRIVAIDTITLIKKDPSKMEGVQPDMPNRLVAEFMLDVYEAKAK